MTTDVDLANRALSAIGTRSTITSLSDGSNEATQFNIVYAPTRDQLLRAANWNFARKTAILTLYKSAPGTPENPTPPTTNQWSTSYPPPPWLYEYAYPADCVRARRIIGQGGVGSYGVPLFALPVMPPVRGLGPAARFAVAYDTDASGNPEQVILTDQENALVIYTATFDAPAMWTPDFQEALVSALAGRLSLALTGDKSLAKMKLDMANMAIAQARIADGNEGLTVMDGTPDWIATRGIISAWQSGDDGSYESPFGPEFSVPL